MDFLDYLNLDFDFVDYLDLYLDYFLWLFGLFGPLFGLFLWDIWTQTLLLLTFWIILTYVLTCWTMN